MPTHEQAEKDTEALTLALAEYRHESRDETPYQDLPAGTMSRILQRAQALKAAAQAA